jgi:hypothetical protein
VTIPLTDKLAEQGDQMPYGIAFELLSKPTLELTDDDLIKIANDLRAKRIKFLQGVADRPGSTARIAKPKPTDEEKKARTEHIKQSLNLGNLKLDL